jgi:hypothetical protein
MQTAIRQKDQQIEGIIDGRDCFKLAANRPNPPRVKDISPLLTGSKDLRFEN